MKKTEIILKEGYPFIVPAGVIFLISLIFGFGAFWQILFFIIFAFFVYFFRNPERIPDEVGENVIISPADGEIIEITETKAPILNKEMIKISIRLSIFDVHVQRSPIIGEIVAREYIHGLFLNIADEKSSELNEQNRVLFEGIDKVVVNQIAGFLTRRIIMFRDLGKIKLSERYGMIMFGSQVDLYVPKNSVIKITEFQKVKAGESLIGYLNEN
ncbi:phosphatidylserine decarboxylase [Lebetimonas sp. JH292]|uniref:phosphatidylserine decarboxylase n=1 Tax=Lebetimonas sp. JH292 TaxID=990068 RepID=UPI0004671882|nr:phosphatidylserine decarboxylase [Lebetimonas sp. JH292]